MITLFMIGIIILLLGLKKYENDQKNNSEMI